MSAELDPGLVERLARAALEEDRAFDDVTTLATVDPGLEGRAAFLAKEAGVLAGMPVAAACFRLVDSRCRFDQLVGEGERFDRGAVLASVTGPVRALLQAERVALNFVQRLSGTATLTRAFVDAVAGTKAVILDTRKTTPGLRDLEKYAVRCGGGTNHRRDLAAMAMVKDNHREAIRREGRTLAEAAAAIRALRPGVAVEIEIDGLDQLDEALAARPEWILLDNMPLEAMAEAVRRVAGRAKLEASGGVRLETVRAIARTGVDAISAGALTHSARALDISLELEF
ncbi:carboxylating nicotinate-nucleotide diphosphorylase [Tepidiforma sp.]|uniref:carboxylating nicotinate-nucleotide diphosphorylase n=1 Tax=Tepidiforma sp. TaxID=2682230 RepID=UPI0021DEE6E7|nr:carboxylating nicotinate-nucleotide diphosphorylase [Tepidiforma sp.]MCX7617423.1 carboxylating nicotinate-nucleotide diphosphorylase [Tepidiforma sp.]GIW17479.1 MAG: nicotinate-nucleotide diphosphorylase (carboxylating) [Tepidiforma sp.]